MRDGRLARFEVLEGTRRLLLPGVVLYLRSGAIRPRADSPWFGAAPEPEAEPAGAVDLLPEGWPAAGDAEPLHQLTWDDDQDWETFGRLWGRWAPESALADREYWQEVCQLVLGWLSDPPPPINEITIVAYVRACDDAVKAVAAGFRWDAATWAARSAEMDLEFGITEPDT